MASFKTATLAVFVFALLAVFVASRRLGGRPGGLGREKPADSSIQSLIEEVRGSVESRVGQNFASYEAVSYKSQVVAGTVYYVKVKVAEGDFIHVKVFRPLPVYGNTPRLMDVQTGKAENDAIEYF
ncbi:hypothetical protein KUTeg_024875 [Tegillarca granosa]|uniref:Cystatin domain-containing protein n=1 Tax=Tegillarca granosa TaxID=220873 RepID=A0ABQ9DXU9_TEGGR|nr:hypothetical protein KUTeg_024425 [Tegillarca granosa]KAJ8298344.1 hypothetical protein KUTeg_024875 [Tegillarca granosa]